MSKPIKEIRIEIEDYVGGMNYDVSDKVVSITKSMSMESSPGKCEVVLAYYPIFMRLGSILRVWINKIPWFNGRIFFDKTSSDGLIVVTAYDALHAFKGSDSMVFENKNLTQVFKEICGYFGTVPVIHDTARFVLPKIKTNGATFFSVIMDGINRTLIATGDLWVIRGNWDQVEFLNTRLHFNRNPNMLIIGDASLATSFSLTRSAENIFNYVRLVNENNDDKVRHISVAQDAASQRQFGKLMTVERTSDKLNYAQVTDRARQILQSKTAIKSTFDISVAGHESLLKLRSGDSVVVNLQELYKFNLGMRNGLIDGITHKIDGSSYTVDLNLLINVYA